MQIEAEQSVIVRSVRSAIRVFQSQVLRVANEEGAKLGEGCGTTHCRASLSPQCGRHRLRHRRVAFRIRRERGNRVDGEYVDRAQLLIPDESFLAHDLRRPLKIDRRFDLAISLETAHYLSGSQARSFVEKLASLAPAVLFSSAVPHQANHAAGAQWPAYWCSLFATSGYEATTGCVPESGTTSGLISGTDRTRCSSCGLSLQVTSWARIWSHLAARSPEALSRLCRDKAAADRSSPADRSSTCVATIALSFYQLAPGRSAKHGLTA